MANSCFVINGFFFIIILKVLQGKRKRKKKILEERNCYAKPAKSVTQISLLHSAVSSLSLISLSYSNSLLSLSFSVFHSQGTSLSRSVLLVWEQVSGSSDSPVLHLAPVNLCQVQFLPYASTPIFCKMGITVVPSPQRYGAAELISTSSPLRSWKENSIAVLSIILNNYEHFHYISLFLFSSQIALHFFVLLQLSLHFFHIFLSSSAMVALSNGPSRNAVQLHLL